MGKRDELIRLQRATLRSILASIRDCVGPSSSALKRYRGEYRREVRSHLGPSTKQALVDAAAAAQIVYCGDYHSLAQAQRSILRVLREVLARGRSCALALEMFPSSCQRHLNDFVRGRINETTFLARVDYHRIWGFPWENYRPLLLLARETGMPTVGLNRLGLEEGKRLRQRDEHAAQRIAALTAAHEDATVFVVFGDLHVASTHLPARTRQRLAAMKIQRRELTIFQNEPELYFALAEEGQEERVDVLRIRPDAFCILSATPWAKVQTYLDWIERQDRVDDDGDPSTDEEPPDLEDRIYALVRELATFFDVDGEELFDFHVSTIDDEDFLARVVVDPPLLDLVLNSNALFLPAERRIYLAVTDLNHAAEGAAEFLHSVTSGYAPEEEDLRHAFYQRVIRKTMAFFGSKLINHKRKCDLYKDHEAFLLRSRRRVLVGEERIRRSVSRLVVQHQHAVDEALESGRDRLRLRAVYAQDPRLFFGVSKALGYITGDKLYKGLIEQNVVTERTVRALFRHHLGPKGAAETLYLDLRRRLKRVKKVHDSKDEFF